MSIVVPKEIKAHGHDAFVGAKADLSIMAALTAADFFSRSEMSVKTKKPQVIEPVKLRKAQPIYPQLRVDPEQAKSLLEWHAWSMKRQ